ncbi:MAG: peptide chain release factor N(5)-glutamine methyltransferase [Thermomicrobiales bacterium]|nr:peptide chain release factor N(5)-glutamine methyltransferase [Thermomicrobiales bacterium]MCO5219472.1 peptide chain release factor N(5)-glutamine methyltransferase [Thermomicrobiales bacterium]MCO5226270.1 peptide chain release factor N(5)-glutamine methyltransferase [Thermomicrobiales bacterium]
MTSSTETIHALRQWAASVLMGAGVDPAMLDARVLLGYVLDLSATQLLIADNDLVSPDKVQAYRALIDQRATGVPLAYLTGSREFMGLAFHTTPAVLVPRPDTEPLVEWALNCLEDHPAATIVDIGTGSGAITVSMVYHAPEIWTGQAIAIDVSLEALAVATENADRMLPADRRDRIEFRLGDLTASLEAPVDLLLANLPYLTPGQMDENPDLRHEPSLALDGGDDGLDLVREVIDDLPRVLAANGAAGFEIDPSQSATVQSLLHETLPDHRIAVVHDLAGDERHIVAFRP